MLSGLRRAQCRFLAYFHRNVWLWNVQGWPKLGTRELSIQGPVKFELVVNLKTAKALGLDVPFLLQQRAVELIE